MDSDPQGKSVNIQDETYLEIWKVEQEHVRHRWTVTTFFISVSFAIFGLSLQGQPNASIALLQRIAAVIVYWFSYIIFLQLHRYTAVLRGYLREMEKDKRTSLMLQSRTSEHMIGKFSRHFGTRRLLLYFGILYTLAVLILRVSGI